ncbi:hypothetical protein ACS0TY_025594 [Phlomoides rotata]
MYLRPSCTDFISCFTEWKSELLLVATAMLVNVTTRSAQLLGGSSESKEGTCSWRKLTPKTNLMKCGLSGLNAFRKMLSRWSLMEYEIWSMENIILACMCD